MVFKFLIYKHVIIYNEFGFKSKTAPNKRVSDIKYKLQYYDIVVQNNLYIETSKYNY